MKFKEEHMKEQFDKAAGMVQEIVEFADSFAKQLCEKEMIVTRVSDPVPGESGVHVAIPCRGVDCRSEYPVDAGIVNRYTFEEVEAILDAVNKKFPRTDGKLTVMHHSFDGGPHHFHLQSRWEDLTPEEKKLAP